MLTPKPEETRIYVVVAGTIQVPSDYYIHNGEKKPKIMSPLKTVVQPPGRQIAQACHVVSKLRQEDYRRGAPYEGFLAVTTIILQARDSAELGHVHYLLIKKRLNPEMFSDTNSEYGPGEWPTAIAVFAKPSQTKGILDYLPLWSGK